MAGTTMDTMKNVFFCIKPALIILKKILKGKYNSCFNTWEDYSYSLGTHAIVFEIFLICKKKGKSF